MLRRVFRGKFVDALEQAFQGGLLRFVGNLKLLAEPKIFAAWLRPLYRKNWVVYLKRPFGDPEYVLQYLGRSSPAYFIPLEMRIAGVGVAGLLALALLLVPLPTVRAEIAIPGSTRLPVLLAAMPKITRRLGLDWLMLALLLAWASVKLSARLASWKS